LQEDAVISKMETTAADGKSYVTAFYNLDYAENQAAREIPMKMADWVQKIDAFLQFNEYKILKDAGKVSHEVAKKLAEKEYEKYRITQDKSFESDFDKEVKKLNPPKKKK